MNIQKIMKEAQRAQKKAAEVQERLGSMMVVGSAGGGMVEVTSNGHGQIMGVKLKPEAVDKDDLEALEDLLLVAIQDAQKKGPRPLGKRDEPRARRYRQYAGGDVLMLADSL